MQISKRIIATVQYSKEDIIDLIKRDLSKKFKGKIENLDNITYDMEIEDNETESPKTIFSGITAEITTQR